MADNPDDADLHTLQAVVWGRSGLYADALHSFMLGIGSTVYEGDGLEAHADALRMSGLGLEAAAVRSERIWNNPFDERREIIALLGLVDDYRVAGDVQGAYEAGQRALMMTPRGPTVHAYMADLALDIGDLDSADWHLWMAQRSGDNGIRLLTTLARRAAADGDLPEAIALVVQAKQKRPKNMRVRALYAELLRVDGQLGASLDQIDLSRHGQQEHPYMFATEAMVLADLGREGEANEVLARATALYPHAPPVRQAVAYLSAR